MQNLLPLVLSSLLNFNCFNLSISDNCPSKFSFLSLHIVASDIQVLMKLVLLLPPGKLFENLDSYFSVRYVTL